MSLAVQHRYAPFPGGLLTLHIPERGMVGSGNNFENLCANVKKYRVANGFPVGIDIENEIGAEVCKVVSSACFETDYTIPQQRTLQWNDVVTGAAALGRFKLAGSPFVSESEALRRATICAACPHNQTVRMPCSACRWDSMVRNLIVGIVGAQSTPLDAKLLSCSICACPNAATVHLPLDIQHKALSDAMKAQFKNVKDCWKAEGL